MTPCHARRGDDMRLDADDFRNTIRPMTCFSLAALRRAGLRRFMAALFVWATMWSAVAAASQAHAKPASVDLPFVFCAFGSEAPPPVSDMPAHAPAGERSLAGHCVMCLAGAGPALPPPVRGVGAPSVVTAIVLPKAADAPVIDAVVAGTVGARAPPVAI